VKPTAPTRFQNPTHQPSDLNGLICHHAGCVSNKNIRLDISLHPAWAFCGDIPGYDETGSTYNLRSPINAVDQSNIIRVDYPWYSGNCTDPENSSCRELYCRSNEADFVPASTIPDPFLDMYLWLIWITKFDSIVEVVCTLRQRSTYCITETYLRLATIQREHTSCFRLSDSRTIM